MVTKASVKKTDAIQNYVKVAPSNTTIKPSKVFSVTSRSSRYGGCQECALNPTAGRTSAIYRGAWESQIYNSNHSIDYMSSTYIYLHYTIYKQTDTSSLFCVNIDCFELLSMAGKAVNGWPNCNLPVHLPSCDCFMSTLNEEDKTYLRALLKLIFKHPKIMISDEGNHLHVVHVRSFSSLSSRVCK